MALTPTLVLLQLLADLVEGSQLSSSSREWLYHGLATYCRAAGMLSLDAALGLAAPGQRHPAAEVRRLKASVHLRTAAALVALDDAVSTWARAGRLAEALARMIPSFQRARSGCQPFAFGDWAEWQRALYLAWRFNPALPVSQRGLYRVLTRDLGFSCQSDIAKVMAQF